MTLSQTALDILTSIQFSSSDSIGATAKTLGLKEHTVHYHLRNLIRIGALKPHTFMNVFPLGLIDHAIFFSLADASEKLRKRLLDKCLEREGVCWLAELGGDFQYAIALKVTDICKVHMFMESFAELLGDVFHERAHATRISQTEFGVRSLSRSPLVAKPYFYGQTNKRVTIDLTDHKLLRILARSPGKSPPGLSRLVGIPQSTVRYRLERLEREGVVTGYRYLVDSSILGLEVFRVLISSKGISSALTAQIKKFAAADCYVSHFVECLGSWDYEIQLFVPNFRVVRTFCNSMYDAFGSHIHWLKVIAIFSEPTIIAYPFDKPPAWISSE